MLLITAPRWTLEEHAGTLSENSSPCCHSVCMTNTQLPQHSQDSLLTLPLLPLFISISPSLCIVLLIFCRTGHLLSSASTWFFSDASPPTHCLRVMISAASDSFEPLNSFSQRVEETLLTPPAVKTLLLFILMQICIHAGLKNTTDQGQGEQIRPVSCPLFSPCCTWQKQFTPSTK